MDPNPIDVRKLALYDPISAYGIMLGSPRVPFFMNATGTFSSFALNQLPLSAPIDANVSQRTWITRVDYSLQAPNLFAGNVFQSLYIAALKQSPGVSVRVTVLAGPRYDLCPNMTPLENLTSIFNDSWASGWVLYPQQSIKVEYQLTQSPPAVSPNAPPYTITTTFSGWQFLDPTIDTMCADEAADKLRKAGIDVPNVKSCR